MPKDKVYRESDEDESDEDEDQSVLIFFSFFIFKIYKEILIAVKLRKYNLFNGKKHDLFI